MTDGVLTVLPAPEGYEVNFENPPQVGHIAGYFVTGVGISLAAAFLGMRLYTRCFITRNFGLEDGTSSCVVSAATITDWFSCGDAFIRTQDATHIPCIS